MADKKLLEESVIARFQTLANIKGSEKGVLTESKHKGGKGEDMAGGRSAFPQRDGDRRPKREAKAYQEEAVEEAVEEMEETVNEEAEEEASDDMGSDMPDMDMGGDDAGAGMEGGDLESSAENLVNALNDFFVAAGLDKEVDVDSGSEAPEAGEGEEEEVSMQPAPMMEKKEEEGKKEEEEEELDESIELVDDALVEKLLQRVTARLVAEARKAKESKLAEGKKGSASNWLAKPGPGARAKGHGPKKVAPFNKPLKVSGTAGRGKK